MYDLCLLNVIVPREQAPQLDAFWEMHHIGTHTSMLCRGTATKSLLDLLGLENSEKTLAYVMTSNAIAKRLMNALVSEMGLNMPGNGVAFTVPVGSVAGSSSLNILTHNQDIILEEVKKNVTYLYELIIAIVNRGHVDDVMDAAREAGAMGGTVIHAKGTNRGNENMFFGVSIADEKEMLLILSTAEQRKTIMRSIMDKAGVHSPAHTVMFSLPVSSVAGLRSIMVAAGEIEE